MAGLYIKGMEMPKDKWGYTEIQIWGDGLITTREGKMLTWGKYAIEVPDHGDLIDRETIVDSVCDGVCSCSECSFNQNPFDSCVLQTNLKKLKVIIPAERSEDE